MKVHNPKLESQTTSAPQSSRGRERYARILDAATDRFLHEGYAQTSIDGILEQSGGSKATLYSYFPTKDDLFRAVIDSVVLNRQQPMLDIQQDIRATLVEYGVQRLRVVFSTQHRALLRVIIAERQKFPDLASTYFERGPQWGRQLLGAYLDKLKQDGLIAIENTAEATGQFVAMLMHQWYLQSLLIDMEAPSDTAIREKAERTVSLFLATYNIDL